MVVVVGRREVEVFKTRVRNGVARGDEVDLAVEQHLFTVIGQDGDKLDVLIAQALSKTVHDVDLEAVVVSRLLVEIAKSHDVGTYAGAQRSLTDLLACSGAARLPEPASRAAAEQGGYRQRRARACELAKLSAC